MMDLLIKNIYKKYQNSCLLSLNAIDYNLYYNAIYCSIEYDNDCYYGPGRKKNALFYSFYMEAYDLL